MSKTAQDLLRELPEGKVLERLKSCGYFFSKRFQPKYKGVYLCLKLLRNAIEHALLDILYVKKYHGIEYADEHKRAAFAMYWISKIKPIQIDTNANFKESHLVINEIFGIHLGLDHLQANISDISPGYFAHLLRVLHTHNISPLDLASEMYVLECALHNKKP